MRGLIAPVIRHFGDTPLTRIDQEAIEKGARRVYPTASPATRSRQFYTPTAAVMHHAAKRGWCARPIIERPAIAAPPFRWLTPVEAERLIAASGAALKPLLTFMLFTGARSGEALGLDWREVDLGRGHVAFLDTKNGESRGMPMHRRVVAELANLRHRDGPAYIGDAAEYKRMKQLQRPRSAPAMRHVQQPDGTFSVVPLVQSEGEIQFEEISAAMEALTHRRQSESVGAIAGCVTRVVDARISWELEYLQSVEVSVTPWEGNSGFSLLASNSGTRGIGIYYRSGKMGFLFVVGDREPCHKEAAETIKQFIEVARARHGLNLVGGA